jgi:hypothetical protein
MNKKFEDGDPHSILDKIIEADRKYVRWMCRIALVPLVVLSLGLVFVVLVGIWSGETNGIRYSSAVVVRSSSPIQYWLSVFYHSALAAFICWATLLCYWGADFRRREGSA